MANDNGSESVSIAVVMVPLPAQGHLNQLLHLSRLITNYNIPLHFVGSTTHTRQAKTRVHGWKPLSVANMHFHEFSTPRFDNPPPNHTDTNKFPSQIIPCLRAANELREPVNKLVQELSATFKRVVIVYDSSMAHVVQDIGTVSNAEAYCFQSISAFSLCSFYWEYTGKPNLTPETESAKQAPSMVGCFSPEFAELMAIQQNAKKVSSGDIYNTARVIDGSYLDLLAKDKCSGTDRCWAIGPFNPIVVPERRKETKPNDCLEWLDKQETNSVIFVSFGTTCSLSDEEVHEIAIGLEKSDQPFIWVLRDADKGDIFDGDTRRASLPQGYEERIRGRGLILRDWAPQLEILAHGSTGGFISHCGWNSSIESISMGVPIGAWPMHSDQPRNAFLITDVLKIGVEVRDWKRRDELVSSFQVEKAVRRLMASEEGDEIRKRAGELGDAVRSSVMEGGESQKDMDSFIAHITRN